MVSEDMNRRFWELVALLGYPVDPRGVKYGTREYRIFRDIEYMWQAMPYVMEHGQRALGWAAAGHYSSLAHTYRFAYLAARLVLGDIGDVKELADGAIEWVNERCEQVETVRQVMEIELKPVIQWVERGGAVEPDDVLKIIGIPERHRGDQHDVENVVQMVKAIVERDLGNAKMNRVLDFLAAAGVSDGERKRVKDEFLRCRERALGAYRSMVQEVRALLKISGNDHKSIEL